MSRLQLRINSWGQVVLDKRELRAVMRGAGNLVKSKTAALINKTAGTGRAYRGGAYRASAPGQPPIRLSGALRNSLRVYTFKDGAGFAVRERQFYALFLEAGAKGGGPRRRRQGRSRRVLMPRPHLDRVMAEEAPVIDRRVREAITKGLKWRQTK